MNLFSLYHMLLLLPLVNAVPRVRSASDLGSVALDSILARNDPWTCGVRLHPPYEIDSYQADNTLLIIVRSWGYVHSERAEMQGLWGASKTGGLVLLHDE